MLHAFASEENGQARIALLGAAGSLLRGVYYPLKRSFLHEMGGLELLQSVLETGEDRVARKALVLLLDLQLSDIPTSGEHYVKKTLTSDRTWARRILQVDAKTHDSRAYALRNLACLAEFRSELLDKDLEKAIQAKRELYSKEVKDADLRSELTGLADGILAHSTTILKDL